MSPKQPERPFDDDFVIGLDDETDADFTGIDFPENLLPHDVWMVDDYE